MATKDLVLLYHPKTFHEENYAFFWIPYSVLTVATKVSAAGYHVVIIDNNAGQFSNNRDSIADLVHECRIVGISCMVGRQILDGLEFASFVRDINPKAVIVWGGYAPSMLTNLFSGHRCVDVVVRGPGDAAFFNVVKQFSDSSARHSFAHLATLDSSLVIDGKASCLSERPPFPFNLVNIQQYVHNDPEVSGRTINYVSSQGCPFRCGFCADVAMYRQRWVASDPDRILNDVALLRDYGNINGVKFYDANFFANHKRLMLFTSLLCQTGMNIKWAASAHPNNLLQLSRSDLAQVFESGCTRILIGAESGSQKTLDLIRKGVKLDDIRQVARELSRIGIRASFTLIIGFPGESVHEVGKTIEFAQELLTIDSMFEAKVHFYFPYPGTPLYECAVAHGFRAPSSLVEWAHCDYYKIETPWIDRAAYDEVRSFNESNCPYVNLSRNVPEKCDEEDT